MATVTAFILVTCAKNTDVQPSEAPLEPGVAAAKEAFGQYLQTIPKARVANFARLARQGSQRTIHWELAETVETGAFAGMRIPVSYPSQRTTIIDDVGNRHLLERNTWLLAQDDPDGGYRFSMLTALPTGKYLANPDDGYSGVLEVTDWNGELLTAYIYVSGTPMAVSSSAHAARSNRPALLMGVDNTGDYICVPVMAETCVGNPADPNDDYICNTQQVGQHCCFTGGNPEFPPLDDLPEPEVWYGSGGGTGNNATNGTVLTAADLEDATVYQDEKPAIGKIDDYLDCFNDGKTASSYKITVYVNQPVSGTNAQVKITPPSYFPVVGGISPGITIHKIDGDYEVGHAFVGFEKHNADGSVVRQVLGFYPSNNGFPQSKGRIKDNGGDVYDVSYTKNVTAAEFNSALNGVKASFSSEQYLLNGKSTSNNCADAALNWANKADFNLSNSKNGVFKNTPGDLGQTLRSKNGSNKIGGNAPNSKGPCN